MQFHSHLVNANIFQEMELRRNTGSEYNNPPSLSHSLVNWMSKSYDKLVRVELKLCP